MSPKFISPSCAKLIHFGSIILFNKWLSVSIDTVKLQIIYVWSWFCNRAPETMFFEMSKNRKKTHNDPDYTRKMVPITGRASTLLEIFEKSNLNPN